MNLFEVPLFQYGEDITPMPRIAVIIPVRGRFDYRFVTYYNLLSAAEEVNNTIDIVFVEHAPERSTVINDAINVFIQDDLPFNKCLCFNAGVISVEADYYLLHDVDILVPDDFFIKLFDNLKDYDALQTFTNRRLMQASVDYTNQILAGEETFRGFEPHMGEPQQPGAVGGSLFIKRELFIKVGGFDPELFTEYSVEDQFFWDKINLIGKVGFCDNPEIELLHLYHEGVKRITKDKDWDAYHSWKRLPHEAKLEYIQKKSDHLKKFL